MKPLIDLSSLSAPLFGIIIPCTSGVLWTSQVGGTSCCHPKIEGLYIPLTGEPPVRDPLLDQVSVYDAALVQAFLAASGLSGFEPVADWLVRLPRFGGTETNPIHLFEAWVPVSIIDTPEQPHLLPFEGRWGVLVYPNSD